jgi:hypothetical protein
MFVIINLTVHHDVSSETTQSQPKQMRYKVFSEIRCAVVKKLLQVMSTNDNTGLNPFNFICKHFLHICLLDVSYVRSYCSL